MAQEDAARAARRDATWRAVLWQEAVISAALARYWR
jgi:hypothetical protein